MVSASFPSVMLHSRLCLLIAVAVSTGRSKVLRSFSTRGQGANVTFENSRCALQLATTSPCGALQGSAFRLPGRSSLYEVEEARSNPAVSAALRKKAEGRAGLGDNGNYRKQATTTGEYAITGFTSVRRKRCRRRTKAGSFGEFHVVGGGGRARTSEGLASGFTVIFQPLKSLEFAGSCCIHVAKEITAKISLISAGSEVKREATVRRLPVRPSRRRAGTSGRRCPSSS
jgi:hypothetical protein